MKSSRIKQWIAALCLLWIAATPFACNSHAATVGGRHSPKGEEIQIDYPGSRHIKNTGGSDGYGLCVFTSLGHAADWQAVEILTDFQRWMKSKPGGGYPEKVDRMIAKKCEEAGEGKPRYLQIEGADIEILKLAVASGRMPSITYFRSPTGRYRGQGINHMVNLVHAEGDEFAILDNNYPGSDRYEWMNESEFRRCYAPRGKGWAVVLLDPGPPLPPFNRVVVQEKRHEMAERASLESPFGAFSWILADKPRGMFALHRGFRQVGIYSVPTETYQPFFATTMSFGRKCKPPCPPPLGWFGVKPTLIASELSYKIGDTKVSRETARKMIEQRGNPIPDERGKYSLTIIAGRSERKEIEDDILSCPCFDELRKDCTIRLYSPDNWVLPTLRLSVGKLPTIYYQAPTGKVLHRQEGYDGGVTALSEALLRSREDWNPDLAPDRRQHPLTPLVPLTEGNGLLVVAGLLALGGGLYWLYTKERV